MRQSFEFGTNVTKHGVIDHSRRNSPIVLFIVGTSGGALTERFDSLAESFAQAGFAFVRFNFRGQESGADFNMSTLSQELEDIDELVKSLESMGYDCSSIGVLTKSFGAVRFFASKLPERTKILGMQSPALFFGGSETISKISDTQYGKIEKLTDAVFPFKTIHEFTLPTIIVHGDADPLIPLANSESMLEILGSAEKELKVIENADHTFKDLVISQKSNEYFIEFFKKQYNIH